MTDSIQPLIFSDLDGTLLDTRSYSFHAADRALALIRERAIPLILASSKTLTELQVVQRAMGIRGPLIFENGAGLAVPAGYFDPSDEAPETTELRIQHSGPGYPVLRRMLLTLRQEHGFAFRGFGDMSVAEVVAATGLDDLAAQRARQRQATEPIQWQDSAAAQRRFRQLLAQRGLRLLAGGRFLHVMPAVDKAQAMRRLVGWFRTLHPDREFQVIAAGDSDNDRDMLQAADLALIIRKPDGGWLPLSRDSGVIRTRQPGPAGWQEGMDILLDGTREASNE